MSMEDPGDSSLEKFPSVLYDSMHFGLHTPTSGLCALHYSTSDITSGMEPLTDLNLCPMQMYHTPSNH